MITVISRLILLSMFKDVFPHCYSNDGYPDYASEYPITQSNTSLIVHLSTCNSSTAFLQESILVILSEMSGRSTHTPTFPELHKLYHYSTPSHILGSSILARNILRHPAMLVHENPYQISFNSSSSSNSSSSTDITPKKPMVSFERNSRPYSILQGSTQVVALLAVAPIERVYLLMQSQNELLKYGYLSSPYKGMKDCLFRTVKNEGVLSLWRGCSIAVLMPLTFQVIIYQFYIISLC